MNAKKIQVPFFINDPLVGRVITFLPMGLFHDHIIIENNKLTYKSSKLFTKSKKQTYNLSDLSKILLRKNEVSCWTKDLKFDPYAVPGTDVLLYLVDNNGVNHELLPAVLVSSGQKQWAKFINELCEATGLPVEEINETSNKNKF